MLEQIAEMLKRKREIDLRNADALNMASYDRWLVDAIEMLLMAASEAAARPR